jgi:hypothetical protein
MPLVSFLENSYRGAPSIAPVVDAPGSFAPLGGGAFLVEYSHVDARALEQLRFYSDFVHARFPDWHVRFEAEPAGESLGVRMFVFPSQMAPSFMGAQRKLAWTGR